MTATKFAFPVYVEQSAEVRSGSPCVVGTGVRVAHILRMYLEDKLPVDQVARELDLPLAVVHGAIAFGLDNAAELEQEEHEREQWAETGRTRASA